MNLLRGGSIRCFSPVSYLSVKDLHLIRPMVFATEREVANVVKKLRLPVVKSTCPVDGVTERQRVKQLLNSLEKDYEGLRKKTLNAMQRAGISGF